MARTGSDENKQANQQMQAQQKKAFDTGQAGVNEFNTNYATLKSGGQIAPNPWKSADYLGNVNRLQSGALNAEEDAGRDELTRLNLRTGGLNDTATTGAITDLKLRKMRLADQLSAERAATDFNRNLIYQTQLAEMPLEATNAESGYYGTATSGRGTALKNLTDLGIAAYGPWTAAIAAAGQAGSAAINKGASGGSGCWIAEAIYGEDDWRTHTLRAWLNSNFKRTWMGARIMALYLRHGQTVAPYVKRFWLLRVAFRPFFEWALRQAMAEFNRGTFLSEVLPWA